VIDRINILQASILAMQTAISKLKTKPDFILVDGNQFNDFNNIPYECIIKGDGKYLSIAAASILAKVYRDRLMKDLDDQYPMYEWKKNKGYPTKNHKLAVKKYGHTQYHRLSFKSI
jgi:ribonuclease HII